MDYLSKESQLNINIGKIIPLKRMNIILFGTKNEWIVDKILLLNSGLVKEIKNNYFLLTNKVSDYLELVKSQDLKTYFPYNYYKYFCEENNNFSKIINTMDKYIEYLDTVGDQFSYLIKNVLHNGTFLNAEIVESKEMLCIQFDKKVGKSLYIFLSEEVSIMPTMLCYSEQQEQDQYSRLYESHKNTLLMDDPEEFLISSLEKVTGNLEFSEMAVKSYLVKNDFQTPLHSICELISWKNDESMNTFIDMFVNKYFSITKVIDGEYMTNFEGLNKFLLSIDTKYLQQWENKEQINELYYQITHELIKSYEILYKHK
jgi:hypothetical protein